MIPNYLGKLTWIYFFTTLGLACAYSVTEQIEFEKFNQITLPVSHRNTGTL